MKNKFLLLSLCASLFVGLASCGPTSNPSEPTAPTVEPTTPNDGENPNAPVTPPSYDGDSIWFHYHRPEHDYEGWGLWLWEVAADGTHLPFDVFYEFNGMDDYGAICAQPTSLWSDLSQVEIGLIVRDANWGKDPDNASDRFISISKFTKDENNIYHIYLVSGDYGVYESTAGKDTDIILQADFIEPKRIWVEANHELESYKFYENDVVLKEKVYGEKEHKKYADLSLEEEGNYDSTYTCELKFRKSGRVMTADISTQPLFKTEKFDKTYTYDGELGAIYTPTSTTFKVWSPVSTNITLNIYDNGTPTSVDKTKGSDEKQTYTMEKGEKGVFTYTVNGDLNGKYYTYSVTNHKFNNREIVDPYAKSAGVNGRRGMIIDFNDPRALPDGWNESNWNIHDQGTMTVWETHIADVTSSSTWGGTESNRHLFNGVIEEGTTYTENGKTVKTGYDHIKELGVNTVQLVPVYDQDNNEINKSFNWGYNPLNYNVIEGSYASDAHDGFVRVKEFRNLVKKFNDDGINIIMDVVYNHMSSLDNSGFNILMPGYYFRYKDGSPTSGSGCGNDTASELPMMRKFMIDSTLFLAQTYKLSGYRFDLMGLHDVETMNLLVKSLKENYNEDIVVYGEPWQMSTGTSAVLAHQGNMGKWEGFAGFNDVVRDAIKGSVFDATSTGWATDAAGSKNASYENVANSLLGATPGKSKDPAMNVAYVSCHDNNTIFDKMKLSITDFDNNNPIAETELGNDVLTKCADYSSFANSFVFASQGVSFMNAGEELCRSKINEDNSLNHNSYNATYKCNELDYSRLFDYENIYEEYKFMIDLKQNFEGLNYLTVSEVEENVKLNKTDNKSYIDLSIKAEGREYRIIFASASVDSSATISADLTGYNLVATVGAGDAANVNTASLKLTPATAYYFVK